ncbi:MAG: glycosyltransferase family 2 protein [Clostridia bacterium]|nr:glycosyltransferase family 2 protein [Clostridia bacterium]
MKRVLVGSPIRQKNTILKEFLCSLEEVDKEGLVVDYYFVDDNVDEKSSELLKNFAQKNTTILKTGNELYNVDNKQEYVCNNYSHSWKRGLIEKITTFKDSIIDYAKDNDYDYLFFIDSDIVLHKQTIKHLITRNVDIVSNVFWTQWFPNGPLEPQVWLQDTNACHIHDWDREMNALEKQQSKIDFFTSLRFPGIYEVGGLGACTLLSKQAIKGGVKFKLIDNLSFWGEDRHFCIRAGALGFKLYVDTIYPAYHIYREEYIDRVDEFKQDGFKFDMCQSYGVSSGNQSGIKGKIIKLLKMIKHQYKLRKIQKFNSKRVVGNNKIVLSMVVKNESNRYLEKVLNSIKNCVDDVLIIDDASTDNTVQICEKCLKDVPHTIIKNAKSMFKHEYKLRKKQWKETLKLNPGWILSLDADEVLENSFKEKLQYLININNIDVYNFKLFDMWNDEEYRDDQYWKAHNSYMTFFIRFQPNFKYKFKKTNQHCGRLPKNLSCLQNANVDVRIKHFGWAREQDRIAKYNRYMELDKDGKYGVMDQYKSILDPNPNLKKFEE